MTTLNKLSEQIERLLGGNPSYLMEITSTEIKEMIRQTIATRLKLEMLSVNTSMGDNFPPLCMIATYDNIAVVSYGKRSKSVLPAFPISLPMNQGVWQVSDENNPDRLFIPLQSGQWGVSNSMDYLPEFSGNTGFEVEGLNIIYTTDITKTAINPVKSVRVKLLVSDLSSLGDYDLLPIGEDMESDIIKSVYAMIINEPVTVHKDDGSDPRQPVQLTKPTQ